MELEITHVMHPFAVDPSELCLQVNASDLWPIRNLIPMQGQAIDDGIEY